MKLIKQLQTISICEECKTSTMDITSTIDGEEEPPTTAYFIKLWLEAKHSTINNDFAFMVN